MRYAKFNDALLTGHAEVDEQHRALYTLVNDLNVMSVMGRSGTDDVEAALERILRYAVEHFSTEERLMTRSAYPQQSLHVGIHRVFADTATDMVAEHLSGQGLAIGELACFMEDWLDTHIDLHDRPLIAHLRAWSPS